MIRRSANREGTITFNIEFNSPRQGNSPSRAESDAPILSNQKLRTSFLSVRSNPNLSMDFEDLKKNNSNINEVRSIASEFDCLDLEDIQGIEEPTNKFYQIFDNGDNLKTNPEDFFTQEPIDFDDLRKFGRFDKDDEDKSSVSTLSKSSKKIMKTKAGVVYKESRFKEEARNKGKRQPWQAYEDEQVIDLVNKHGQSWALISSMMEGRTGKQIRDRYLNKLRPDIKNDEWNNEEDQLLISLYHELGRKWSKIATHLPGRTEGQVKNRFYSHISKKLLNSEDLEHTIEVGNTTPPSKLNSKTKNANTSFGQSMSTQACFSKEPKDKFFEEVANLDFNIDFPTSGNKSRFDQILENQEFNIGEPFSIVEFGDPTDVIYDPNFLGSLKKVSPTKRVLDKSNFTFQEENNYQFQQHMNNQNETEQQPFYEELQNDFTKRNISVCFQPETISPTFFGYNQERTTKTSPNQKLMSQIDFGFDFTIPSANYQFEHDFDQVQKKNERNFNTNIQDEIYWTR